MRRPVVLLVLLLWARIAAAHPLDPLSPQEIRATVDVLRDARLVDENTRYPLIDLDEPSKASVLGWRPDRPDHRRSFVIARRDRTVYEGVVDLTRRSVVRWDEVKGVQPAILGREWHDAQRVAMSDPGWQAAMRARGYPTFDRIFCAPFAAGYFADPAEEGRRLLRVACFDAAAGRNIWSRPIEGLYAIVDLDEHKVVRLIDQGTVAASRETADYTGTRPRRPLPAWRRRNFSLRGNEVSWQNWSFRFRMDRRTGLVLSLVRYDDGGRSRMVLYRGSLSEMFVPYMDPDAEWSFRTPLDVGEYGLGLLSSRLAPGIDCPRDAVFVAATLADESGEPVIGTSRICLFERLTGDPLWRHAENETRDQQGRAARELVIRTIPAVGNYDYVVDWVLTEAGEIRIDVGATGIVQVKAVTARSQDDPSAAGDTRYGTLVAPNTVAVNHDHFLSFRLDVDIDGTENTLVGRKLRLEHLGDSGRRSLWRVFDQDVTAEGPLGVMDHGDPTLWRIVNPNAKNALGQHPAYEVRLGHGATSLLEPDDPPQSRAMFSTAPLWVTAYAPGELYAAGPYPNQSRRDDGLPEYVKAKRPVADADIVLWCTIGFHHVPRPEDWPVMPTMWHSLSLVPNGFFDRNPTLDGGGAAGRPQQARQEPP